MCDEEDYSDVLTAAPPTGACSDFRELRARATKLRACLAGIAAVLTLAGTMSCFLSPKMGELLLATVVVGIGAIHLLVATFLYQYWKTLEPGTERLSPGMAAAMTLIPFVDLFCLRRVLAGGGRAGVATIEKLDGNVMRLTAPTKLARATQCAFALWLVFFIGTLALFCKDLLHSPERLPELLELMCSARFMTRIFFVFIHGWIAALAIALFVGQFFSGIAAVGFLFATLRSLERIGSYAIAARMSTEPLATAEERLATREERDRLLAEGAVRNASDGNTEENSETIEK